LNSRPRRTTRRRVPSYSAMSAAGCSLPRTTLGRTGLQVTRLGIGGAYAKTPEEISAALDAGVNYIDTARAYGEDEGLVAKAIAGRDRNSFVLSSKTPERTAAGARKDLATSLRTLGVAYLDVYHVHCVGGQPGDPDGQGQKDLDEALGPGGALSPGR
jgi:aryl-alcohol dehydrogenase-like predicted oxidoreductase